MTVCKKKSLKKQLHKKCKHDIQLKSINHLYYLSNKYFPGTKIIEINAI